MSALDEWWADLRSSLRPDRGLKRKFGFDLDAVSKLAEDAEDAAMVKIEKEQAEARKAKLPAFWL